MRAAVLTAFNTDLSIEQLQPLPLRADEVRVQVEASGICHSDLSVASGTVARLSPPLILGHEAAGTVVEVGRDVRITKVGDTIIAALRPACGRCWFCSRNSSHLCEELATYGQRMTAAREDHTELRPLAGIGSFAELVTIPESMAIPVHSGLPLEQLALLGCGVPTGVGAVLNVARVEPGSVVAVIGCGGVGQAVIQGSRVAGAARIIAIDPIALKRRQALEFGASDCVDPTTTDPVEAVIEMTAGRGVDYAFEVVGATALMKQAYSMTRRGGSVIIVGMAPSGASIELPAYQFMSEGKQLIASAYGGTQARRDLQRIVDLTEAGRIDLAGMVTARFTLDQINEGMRAVADGSVIRAVVVAGVQQ